MLSPYPTPSHFLRFSRRRLWLSERDRATELAEVKSRFLATMSHELRTPLTAIIGYTELLLRQQKQESSQHDQLQLEVVIADDIPAWLLLDPQWVRQILLNLLSNAIKFTEQGKVVLRASRLSAHRLQVEVSDTGMGMEQLEKIFSAFEQADSGTSRKYGGTGLGLHISYQLAELMQGELSVSSSLGQGSHFRLELPLVEPEAEQLPAQLQQLQAFVAKQDEAQILGLLHQIKGTAGSFGLAAISQCAARLEQQQKKGQRITAEDCEALAALMQSA